jgi:hypothetical protein
MGISLDLTQVAPFEQLLMSHVVQQKALNRLLIERGLFAPLESPAARSGDDGCSFFSEHGV